MRCNSLVSCNFAVAVIATADRDPRAHATGEEKENCRNGKNENLEFLSRCGGRRPTPRRFPAS
jgi:hypothetical protein